MKPFLETLRSSMIVQAILSLVLGAFLVIWPDSTTMTLIYLFAAYLVVLGIISVISYFKESRVHEVSSFTLISAVFTLIAALLIFIFPEAVASFFSLILGILLTAAGIVNAVRSFELHSYAGSPWLATLIMSIIMTIGGVLIVVNPFTTTTIFMWVLGGLLIFKGLADLVIESALSRALKGMR